MILNDDEMMTFIDKLINTKEVSLGNDRVYHIPNNKFINKEKINYEQMTHNLMMIYGDKERCEKYIIIFDKMRQFVADILGVTGLERMFSQYYYNIEWNMYTEAKFDKNRWSMYRDHFVHQIRNAYLGYELIWGDKDIQLIELMIETFYKEQNTDFASYINTFINKDSTRNEDDIDQQVRTIFFKTWFIAALFHDIGYPLAHFNRYEKQIERYMPYFRCFNGHTRTEFIDIKAILADSFLFQIVSPEELEDKYLEDDHGMLSAICLLLNYYYTGTIHSIPQIDRCSIELAAYSIFSHTNKYAISDSNNKKAYKHYRPVFSENPLSYLLRICDDLQEWDRMYFLIGKNSNILICKRCLSAIIPDENKILYKCKCGNVLEKVTQFNYRKINLISTCNAAKLNFTSDHKISFVLEYDKMRLIEAVLIENAFAKRRYEELENLKKLLSCQSNFPYFEIKYFLSDNVELLKYEIVRDYMKKNNKKIFMEKEIGTYDIKQIEKESRYLKSNQKKIIQKLVKDLREDASDLAEEELSVICKDVLEQTILFLQETETKLIKGESIIFKNQKENVEDILKNIYFYYLINNINMRIC